MAYNFNANISSGSDSDARAAGFGDYADYQLQLARAQEAGGGNSGGSGGDITALITKAINDQTNAYNKNYNDFTAKYPFNFDTVLAQERTKVSERLDPYYKQTLGDFLQGVTTKRNASYNDEQALLGQLTQDTSRYTENQKAMLNNALEQTGTQYASSGNYNSGDRLRAQGNLEANANQNLEQYNANTQFRQNQIQRQTNEYLGSTLPLAVTQEQRAVGHYDTNNTWVPGSEEYYSTESQSLPQAQQRQSQYDFARQQAAGALPGVTPLTSDQDITKILTG